MKNATWMNAVYFFAALISITFPFAAESQTQDNGKRQALIPAGEFMMGSENGNDAEKPVHRVKLSAYFIDRHVVTNKEYEKFQPGHPRSAHSACDDCPVTLVNWREADAYCKYLGGRLPTEAEWERAARGPENLAWSVSDFADTKKVRFGRSLKDGPVAVDSLPPNGFGLHSMSGNVWEWTGDWFDKKYYSDGPEDNPQGPGIGFRKSVRGGSWHNAGYYANVGMRFKIFPKVRLTSIGFRCASNH